MPDVTQNTGNPPQGPSLASKAHPHFADSAPNVADFPSRCSVHYIFFNGRTCVDLWIPFANVPFASVHGRHFSQFTPPFIHSSCKHPLTGVPAPLAFVPGITLGSGDTAVTADDNPCPRGADILIGEADVTQSQQVNYAVC